MANNRARTLKAISGKHERAVKKTENRIVSGGRTDYVLLLPSEADKTLLYAAEEFTHFFRLATGISLPQERGNTFRPCISLGNTAVAANIQTPFEAFGESGYRICTEKGNYLLKGESLGILNAVYDLLGVLFGYETFSDYTIKIAEGVREVPFYETEITEVPDFRFRSPSHAYIKYNERLKRRLRMTELEEQLGGEGGPYHNNFNFIPPEKFKAAHPKWYSDDGCQMCYTAHGDEDERKLLEEEAASAIARYIRKNPDMPYIAFNHQDNFDWCTCPACTALKEKYEGANSASAAIFLNRVRANLQRWFEHEGKPFDRGQKLVFFAYHGTNQPPVHYDEKSDGFTLIDEETVLKGVIPWFAETNADYTCPLYEGETNRPVSRNLRGWKLLADEILFWTYGTNFENYLAPYYSFGGTQETYRFAKENGAGMVFDECQINTKASTAWEELKGYLGAKLAWNTEENVEELTQNYFAAAYGEAAEQMLSIFREYLALGKRQIAKGYSGWRSEFVNPVNKAFWDRAQLECWERSMSECLKLVEGKGGSYARNIVLERASVRYLLAEVYGDEYSQEELTQRRRAAADDLRASGIDRFNEKKMIETLFEQWGV